MKFLALDTADQRCSVALLADGRLLEREVVAERVHAEVLLPMVEQLLAEAGLRLKALDGLAFGRGPGAFTGLRVAASVAQGLAYGAGIPVVPVSNLAALAASAHRQHAAGRILAALDARMQEVYWGAFEVRGEEIKALAEESLSPPEALTVPAGGAWYGAGSGWAAYPEALKGRVSPLDGVDARCHATAGDIARLGYKALQQGGAVSPERAVPVYLRDNVAIPKI